MKRRCCGCRKTRLVALVLLLSGLAAPAIAQTTQPTASWPDTVNRLSEAVRGKDVAALTGVLERGPIIRTFNSDTLVPLERMLGATTGSRLLSANAYLKLPATLAADMSKDFAAPNVPENVRRAMLLPDPVLERDANEIAARWLVQVLKPASEAPVAVIVLWRPDRNDAIHQPGSTRPIFLLVRGEQLDGQYVVRQVTYGDPLDKSN